MNIFQNKIFQIIASPLSLLYRLIISIRNFCYDHRIFKTYKPNRSKVISVGNISVGGTGKTPVIKFLALFISNLNIKVAILSRGYGRASKGTVIVSDKNKVLATPQESGDEPYLLARSLKGIPVVVEADRYKGALVIEQKFNPDIILLDDGYQHRRIHRDYNIALVDASVGFGSGFLLLAGILREPPGSLKRADLIWLTKIDQAANYETLVTKIEKIINAPILFSCHQPQQFINFETNKTHELAELKNKKVFLFSGIANPDSFRLTITELKAQIVAYKNYPDHYQFSKKDIKIIIKEAKTLNADIILTTEKDYIRIINMIENNSMFYYLTIEIKLQNNKKILKEKIIKIIDKL